MTIPPLPNFRDLAGVPLPRGSITSGRVFRSDDVAIIDAHHVASLHPLNLTHVIDLRGEDELSATGRGPLADHTTHHHLPFVIYGSGHFSSVKESDAPLTAKEVGSWYVTVTLDSAPLIIQGLEILSSADEPAVFHCAAGKDRTGIFAAAILTTLGADPEAIVHDYAETQENLAGVYERLRKSPYGFPLEHFPQAGALLDATEDTMHTFLQETNDRFGGLTSLLRSRGLTDGTIQSLRTRLVTEV